MDIFASLAQNMNSEESGVFMKMDVVYTRAMVPGHTPGKNEPQEQTCDF